MSNNVKLGKEGEEIAAKYMEDKGFVIEAMNWRFGHSEIDIIASKGNWYVFVEVKTRKGSGDLTPELKVDKKKHNFIKAAADSYRTRFCPKSFPRFDVIAISIRSVDQYELFHIEDVFY
jgi:putative endonuclease